MTSGRSAGTSGAGRWPDWAVAFLCLAGLTVAANIVNVLSLLHEHARKGEPIDWWEPAIWEGTSGIAILLLAVVPLWMINRFPPDGWRNVTAHLMATVSFSLGHVALMIALREFAYNLAGARYEFAGGLGSLPYEYRKDLISYGVIAALFWTVPRLRGGAGPTPAAPDKLPPGMIEIDEGPRLIRVPHTELLCARSSGNYVEFFLADGRRPLMRTTLSRVEAGLAGAGFVRAHRCWLVQPDRVVEAVAEGSGDYGLKLADGTEVPLSRRYPQALASLRGGTAFSRKTVDI